MVVLVDFTDSIEKVEAGLEDPSRTIICSVLSNCRGRLSFSRITTDSLKYRVVPTTMPSTTWPKILNYP